jgi:hypothetical protein
VPTSGYTYATGGVTALNGYAEIPVNPSTNSATAVWEVMNTNPATNETFSFGVWTTYVAGGTPAIVTPPPTLGTPVTVNMSFAPTSTGTAASATLTLPRFADTSGLGSTLFNIVQCTTSLLFPFITNQAGFDTGFAIMNTTQDPFKTPLQQGTCDFNFYGQNAPPMYTTGIIPAGNNVASSGYAFLASSIAPSFQGYMIAVCRFSLAHGYSFVSDLGAQKLAHGSLALVLTNGTAARTPIEALSH